MSSRIRVIDSHTGGEPTRVIIDGGPDLGSGSMAERKERFRDRFDHIRSAVVCEPRGSDTVVGAVLCESSRADCIAGVVFFNNVGYLGMCVHGTIGVMVTLAHLDRIRPGDHRLETPVGTVTATLHDSHRVTVTNVPSYRFRDDIELDVPGEGRVRGEIAWGGNWFFLVDETEVPVTPEHIPRLTERSLRIKQQLTAEGITGEDGGEIDHIELCADVTDPSDDPNADSRNFVLCPGAAYDRSPCGTGTSARLACLAADGKLSPGQTWRQRSIVGSIFEGTIELNGNRVIPSVTGDAYITAESSLILNPDDPLRDGIRQSGV